MKIAFSCIEKNPNPRSSHLATEIHRRALAASELPCLNCRRASTFTMHSYRAEFVFVFKQIFNHLSLFGNPHAGVRNEKGETTQERSTSTIPTPAHVLRQGARAQARTHQACCSISYKPRARAEAHHASNAEALQAICSSTSFKRPKGR